MMNNYLMAVLGDPWFLTVWIILFGAIAWAGWICYKEKDKWP